MKVTTWYISVAFLGKFKKAMFSCTDDSNKADTVFNEDLIVMLKVFKVAFLSSNKAFADLQAKQYQDLKDDLLCVSNQMLELKAQNTRLSKEVDALKGKVASLECYSLVELH